MDPIVAFGVISGVASIAGLIYAIYYGRQSRRSKQLAYNTTPALPLATALSPEEDYKLTVLFRRPDKPDELITSAHVRFVRFANFGKEPIRGIDIAPANPLKIVVEGVRVLDLSMTGATRDVVRLCLSNVALGDSQSEAEINFDFLDYEDGGVIKILTVEGEGTAVLCGDIIGMPKGIVRTDQLHQRGWLTTLGWILGVLFQLSTIALTPFLYRWVTGSWDNVWLLMLPLVALILPGLIIFAVAGTIWPRAEPSLPSKLHLPKWFANLTTPQSEVHPPATALQPEETQSNDSSP